MAKKTTTATIVDAEVTEVKTPKTKRTSRKSPIRTRRALDEISAEVEEELVNGTALKSVDDSGELVMVQTFREQ